MPDLAEQIISAVEEGDFGSVRATVAASLRQVVSRPDEFEAVWHPLGFMYIKLNKHQRKTLRLHIWLKDSPKINLATSIIHNHIWNLISYVLCGKIINHNLELDYETSIPNYRIYEISYIDQVNMLYPTDSLVGYKIVNTSYHQVGNKYVIKAGDFHYTEPGGSDVTATIVVADTVTNVPPKSLGPIIPAAHRMERLRANVYEIRSAAQVVLSSINNP